MLEHILVLMVDLEVEEEILVKVVDLVPLVKEIMVGLLVQVGLVVEVEEQVLLDRMLQII